MSPPPGLENQYEEFKNEIRKQMDLILNYYDGIKARFLQITKEILNLKYVLELKKARSIANVPDGDEKKLFDTRQKMYLTKLNTKQILNTKP